MVEEVRCWVSKLLKEFTWDWTWRVMWICLANSFSKTVEVAISPITFRLLASAKMWETKRKFSYNFLHSTSPQSLFISSISHKFSRPNFHITDLKRVLKPLCKIPFDLSIFHLLNCEILWEGNSYHHTLKFFEFLVLLGVRESLEQSQNFQGDMVLQLEVQLQIQRLSRRKYSMNWLLVRV